MSSDKNVKITVKFFANLRDYGPKNVVIELEKDSTIVTILDKYKIPEEERSILTLVNGKPHFPTNYILKNEDIVAIFPPIGGG